MKTRISYTKSMTSLKSPFYKNFEGDEYQIRIIQDSKKHYKAYIIDQNGDCVEAETCEDLPKLKRIIRNLLINKYNVNINEEVRT